MSKLEHLRKMTVIVADTGEIEAIKQYKPTDATTNPSLILKASGKPEYKHLVDKAVQDSHSIEEMMDNLFVNFGSEILDIVPGRVSTEVDARLSFNTEESIAKGRSLIAKYEARGISRERVLIKLASTWEGAQAARVLEKEGIHCNMTLLFSLPQAIECAEAGATLISPFVGRILDWYKKTLGVSGYAQEDDPGVQSVTQIYNYFKKFDYHTQVMGASFRNTDQILGLAGCDLLTISPDLLEDLNQADGEVPQKLDPQNAKSLEIHKVAYNEQKFRWELNDNAMATEKLAEGIRRFAADAIKLENQIKTQYTPSYAR